MVVRVGERRQRERAARGARRGGLDRGDRGRSRSMMSTGGAGAPLAPAEAIDAVSQFPLMPGSSMTLTWAATMRQPSGKPHPALHLAADLARRAGAAEQGGGDREVAAVGRDLGALQRAREPAGERAARNARIASIAVEVFARRRSGSSRAPSRNKPIERRDVVGHQRALVVGEQRLDLGVRLRDRRRSFLPLSRFHRGAQFLQEGNVGELVGAHLRPVDAGRLAELARRSRSARSRWR